MSKRYHLTEETLKSLEKNSDISELSLTRLKEIIRTEPGIPEHKPEPYYAVDPRDRLLIVYNSSRAKRPHDNKAVPSLTTTDEELNKEPNFITKGETTSIIDVAQLSEGFTFINLNLFPALYPFEQQSEPSNGEANNSGSFEGIHFLQWTSSYQDRDWHNMPVADCAVAMERVAALERMLLREEGGYVSFFKNCGRLVGGSIAQGHQQIGFSTVFPREALQLANFRKEKGTAYSRHILEENPADFMIEDFGRVVLLVPYCMRRPYNMMLIVKDSEKQHLYQLDEKEITQVAAGWKMGIQLMRSVLPRVGRVLAYNIVAHTGPGAGIFFDFFPYTQETGGFEHLGLYVCQSTPRLCADYINEMKREEVVIE